MLYWEVRYAKKAYVYCVPGFKKTGSGKIIRSKAFGNHILTKKTTKRKRSIRKSGVLDSANVKSISKLIPYL